MKHRVTCLTWPARSLTQHSHLHRVTYCHTHLHDSVCFAKGVLKITCATAVQEDVGATHCDVDFEAIEASGRLADESSTSSSKPKVTTLVLEYLATNSQSGAAFMNAKKWSYTESVTPPQSVHIESNVGSKCESLASGGICTLTATSGTFPSKTQLILTDAAGQSEAITINIRTSCSGGGITVGDVFGSVKVVGIATTAGPFQDQCRHTKPHHTHKKSKAKLTTLEFEYLASNSQAEANSMDTNKWHYSTYVVPPTTVTLKSSIGGQCGPLVQGSRCTISATKDTFTKDVHLILSDSTNPENHIHISFHTDCKGGGIAVGDVFGSIKIVSMSTTADEDATECSDGKPKHEDLQSITFRYIGANYGGATFRSACKNEQGGYGKHWGFSTSATLPAPENVKIGGWHMTPAALDGDNLFTLSSSSGKMSKKTYLSLYDGNVEVGEVFFNADCHLSIKPGDRFGFLEVVSALTYSGKECFHKGGWRDTYTPTCFPIDYRAEGIAKPTADTGAQNREPATTNTGATSDEATPATTTTTTTTEVGPVFVPVLTTATTSFATTETAAVGGNEQVYAQCEVRLHKEDHFARGVCAGTPAQSMYPNISVGFSNQICHSEDSEVSGASSTIHMTVQPVCKQTPTSEQKYRVCSWQPNAFDSKCSALASKGRNCCDSVAEKLLPPLTLSTTPGCHEYSEGDCAQFYGFNGTHPQLYRLEFVGCAGEIPEPLGCSSSTNGITERGSLAAAAGIAAEKAAVKMSTWSVGLAGLGLIVIAVALRFKRHRKNALDYTVVFEQQPVEPRETGPLLSNLDSRQLRPKFGATSSSTLLISDIKPFLSA